MLILAEPMEPTGRLRSAGTDVSDVGGRLSSKFAEINDALEYDLSYGSFLRVVVNESFIYQQKLAMVGLTCFLKMALFTSFCRKPRKPLVFPKRFNLTTIGKIQREFRDSLQLRIFRRRKRNYIKYVSCSGICSSFMRPTMTPHSNEAPAKLEEEGTCHGAANSSNSYMENFMHASKLSGPSPSNGGATTIGECMEFGMHGDIYTTVVAEPVEAPLLGHSFLPMHPNSNSCSQLGAAQFTNRNSELGAANDNDNNYNIEYANIDDYINSRSGPVDAHIRDDVLIEPSGNSKGNYAEAFVHCPFVYPWAGSSTLLPLSTTCSVSVIDESIITDNSDNDPEQDIEIESKLKIGREIIQFIETTPETGAAATAMVSGSCPVLIENFSIKNAMAVSAGAEAYRKADALLLAVPQVSNDAAVPRAAAAHENLLLFNTVETELFETVETFECVTVETSKEHNAYEKSLLNAFLPVLSGIKEAFANAMPCFHPA